MAGQPVQTAERDLDKSGVNLLHYSANRTVVSSRTKLAAKQPPTLKSLGRRIVFS